MDIKYEIVDLNNQSNQMVPNDFICANICPNIVCGIDFLCNCSYPGEDCPPIPNPGCTYPDLNCGADSIRPDR